VKPAPFALERPATIDEALTLAAQEPEDTRYLAGGQSLMAALNLRLSAPRRLLDLGRLDALRVIEDEGPQLRVGALTTYRQAAGDARVREHLPLLVEAIGHVAHPAIRNRGTLGGSVALADPAAEMPAVCLALQAVFELRSVGGTRQVPAADFFRGMFETALQPGELLVAIRFPKPAAGAVWHFAEIARRRGDYASAGVVLAGQAQGRRLQSLRACVFGVSGRPVLLPRCAANLQRGDLGAAALAPLEQEVEFFGDLHHPAELKVHLTRVLLTRATRALLEELK
jgi:aerobic carbon-monoxide dehydrogenase medium subunit